MEEAVGLFRAINYPSHCISESGLIRVKRIDDGVCGKGSPGPPDKSGLRSRLRATPAAGPAHGPGWLASRHHDTSRVRLRARSGGACMDGSLTQSSSRPGPRR